jgi:hypothetical protein
MGKNIFLHHITKTGGRAVYASVMQQALDAARAQGFELPPDMCGIKAYVAANTPGMENIIGPYVLNGPHTNVPLYGSHVPAWYHHNPPERARITLLRNPLARLLSFYREYATLPPADTVWETTFQCTTIHGWSWHDFVRQAPLQVICHQAFMFSEKMEPTEAVDEILKLDLFWRIEEMEKGLKDLATLMNVPNIPNLKFGMSPAINLSIQELMADFRTVEVAIQRLEPEYAMLALINKALGK